MRGRCYWVITLIATHALPSGAVWALLGFGLAALHEAHAALVAAAVYALVLGTSEVLSLPLHAPSSKWQVPRSWVGPHHPFPRQAIIWGVTLGPGLLTRNAYASMWVAVPLLAACDSPQAGLVAGLAVGLAHGAGRASGIAHNALRLPGNVHAAMLRYFSWRIIDGEALLILGACAAAALGAARIVS